MTYGQGEPRLGHLFFVTPNPALERDMAKGQKKSNKEARKPKADKTKATVATGLFSKGSTSADMVPKGKG
jgi:hypothetical protein